MDSKGLTLKVLRFSGNNVDDDFSVNVDDKPIMIGRATDNDLVLANDEFVSGCHAKVVYENGRYLFSDTSTNGTVINDRADALHHDTVDLKDGDYLGIGEYEILVRINEVVDRHPELDIGQASVLPPDGSEDLRYSSSVRGELDGLGSRPMIDGNDDSRPLDDDKPFIGKGDVGRQHEPLQLPPDYKEDPDFDIPENIEDRLFGNNDTNDQKPPPRADEEPKPAPVKAIDESPSVANVDLFQAFLQGIGLESLSEENLDAEDTMKLMGCLLRDTIKGLRDLLTGISGMKNEIRIPVTIMESVNNNPLKFSSSVDEAIERILTKKHPGYAEPIEAIKGGFDDIKNHQLAMADGIEAALNEILKRFEPGQFTESHRKTFFFNRKGGYWDDYCESYKQNVTQAKEDLFGESFALAYEEKIRLLRSFTKKCN